MLEDKKVIGVNDAFLLGTWIDVCWFGDNSWYENREYVREGLKEFPGLIVTCAPRIFSKPHIKWMTRQHRGGLTDKPGKVFWNLNSGMSAINLALHFGVKRVVLLGFDMDKDTKLYENWHNNHNPKKKSHPMDRWLRRWPDIMKDADRFGLEIVNATTITGISEDVVPRVKLEDLC